MDMGRKQKIPYWLTDMRVLVGTALKFLWAGIVGGRNLTLFGADESGAVERLRIYLHGV